MSLCVSASRRDKAEDKNLLVATARLKSPAVVNKCHWDGSTAGPKPAWLSLAQYELQESEADFHPAE